MKRFSIAGTTTQKIKRRGVILNLEYQASFINAAKKAHETTELLEVDEYPFPIKDVIKSDKTVKLFTFDEFSKITGAGKKDIVKASGTDEAFHVRKGNRKAIVFNEHKYDKRIRFTLAHEYGHLKMNHKGSNFRSIDKTDYKVSLEEYEANTFASCLLFPLNIRHKFHEVMDVEEISELFNISLSASEVAMDIFNEHMDHGLDDYISIYEHKQPSSYVDFLEDLYQAKFEYLDELRYEMYQEYSKNI